MALIKNKQDLDKFVMDKLEAPRRVGSVVDRIREAARKRRGKLIR